MSTRLVVVHRAPATLVVSAVFVAGCSLGAPSASLTPAVPLVPMTALPPITERPEPTTTTEPRDLVPPIVEATINSGDVVDWYRGRITVSTEADAQVTVNGEPAGLDLGGSVTVPIVNAPGDNTIIITATDTAGNTTESSVVYSFDPPQGWIATLGDSIMQGATEEIESQLGSGIVDATVSRQFLDTPELMTELASREVPPQVVVVGLGTNGPVQAEDFDQAMKAIGPRTLVAFINVHVPRDWEATSNDEIAAGVGRYDNAILIDWSTEAGERSELLVGDGFHLSREGHIALAALIAEAIFPETVPDDSQR
ncbi:MAG: hypothetical protein M3092_07975 [Actinomycetia bacterium]|nr:hypothetical protein [Actinomycetes bacterium]